MRNLIAALTWLRVTLLPGYALDLNLVEDVWSQTKRSQANLTASSLDRLAALARNSFDSLQYRSSFLGGAITETSLNLQRP